MSPRLFLEILLLIFVTLKLTGMVNWSWWLVMMPALGPATLLIIVLIVFLITYLVERHGKIRKRRF